MKEAKVFKKCIRCEEIKELDNINFKRRAGYLDFKPPWDRVCRKCREEERKQEQIKKAHQKALNNTRKCRHRDCQVKIKTLTRKVYCSQECHDQEKIKREQERRIESLRYNRENKGEISKKYLVRGRISGVDY